MNNKKAEAEHFAARKTKRRQTFRERETAQNSVDMEQSMSGPPGPDIGKPISGL